MNFSTLPQPSGASSYGNQPWMKDTVQHFFESIAWTGRLSRVEAGTIDSSTSGQSGSLMTMTVYNFFDTFAWDGQPTIAAPIAPLEMQTEIAPEQDDLTLDGFSDLFG